MNEVNVTIAGSVCDVQSTNNTHIVCVTNAQSQSQETKVRVSIGDRGIAKMVRQDTTWRVTPLSPLYVDFKMVFFHRILSLFFSGQCWFLLRRRVVVKVHVGGSAPTGEGLVRHHHSRPDHPPGHQHPCAENASYSRYSVVLYTVRHCVFY